MLPHASTPLSDWSGQATITTRHPASSFRMPVLLINGKPVRSTQTDWAGYEILDVTPAELGALRRGDYHFNRHAA